MAPHHFADRGQGPLNRSDPVVDVAVGKANEAGGRHGRLSGCVRQQLERAAVEPAPIAQAVVAAVDRTRVALKRKPEYPEASGEELPSIYTTYEDPS